MKKKKRKKLKDGSRMRILVDSSTLIALANARRFAESKELRFTG